MTSITRRLVVCAITCLAILNQSKAQKTAEPLPAFDVADIHASARVAITRLPPAINNDTNMRGGFIRGGLYYLRRATMVDLIRTAYDVDSDKVIDGPGWLDKDEFDIFAKCSADATPESLRLMLQALLADRFRLVVHHDTKPFPEYVLTAGKHLQLRQAATGGESGCQSAPQNPQSLASGAIPNVTVSCHNVTMEEFARRLPRMAGNYFQLTPVFDLTGLAGAWDFTLKWTDRALLAAAGTEGIPIFDAVEKQLGLKLEVKDVPMSVVVVDSVNQKPTDNLPGVLQRLPPIPVKFDVADIRLSAPGSTQKIARSEPGGRFEMRGFTLKELIKLAWGIQDLDAIDNDEMLAGAPKWLDKDRFDIVAETATRLEPDSSGQMLRSLLEDRFKLATHNEDRPISVYALVAAKPKLKKADPSNRSGCRSAPAASGSVPIFSIVCRNTTMAQLAEKLQPIGGIYITRPVVDMTGLEGAWDFVLNWSPPHLIRGGDAPLPASATPVAADPNGALTIVEALDRQLGLKLELRKHAMPVLVIDHVEQKPTDN